MEHYVVFLGFELDADSQESAREIAHDMVDGEQEFPKVVHCVGFVHAPTHPYEIVTSLIMLAKSIEEVAAERAQHAEN